jgi:PAS domain S-box-containing protein
MRPASAIRPVCPMPCVGWSLRSTTRTSRPTSTSAGWSDRSIDGGWQVLFMNPQAEQVLGWHGFELAGRDLLDVIDVQDAEDAPVPFDLEACKQSLASDVPYACDNATFRRRDGSRVPVFYSINPVRGGVAAGAVLVFRDLSASKIAAAALREARVEAEAARRAEHAKNEFLAKMSHEMRTPMHGILSFAEFGLDKADVATRAKLRSYFEKIDSSGRRLLGLLDSLLDLSRLESGGAPLLLVCADLASLVATVIDEFGPRAAQREVRIRFDRRAAVEVEVDVEKIMQVIRNLLGNAIKFTSPGGTIEVSMHPGSDRVDVRVADDGIGIPEDELEAVFGKFYQSSRTRSGAGGTGLGLAICRELMELHGGAIRAEQRTGGGTVFVVTVPIGRCGQARTRAGEEAGVP